MRTYNGKAGYKYCVPEKIRDLFEKEIKKHISGIKINSSETDRIPNTGSVTFPDISSETLLVKLDLNGIAASSSG